MALIDNTSSFDRYLMAQVKSVISSRLEKECKKAIDEAKAKVEESVAQIVAGISLNLMKQVSLEYRRDELLIHVKMGKDNP